MVEHVQDRVLVRYLQGELPAAQQPDLELHVAQCAECKKRLAAHQKLQRHIQLVLQADLSAAHPTAQMTFAAIAPRLRAWSWAPAYRWAGAAALIALVALGVAWLASAGIAGRAPGPARSIAVAPIPSTAVGTVLTASLAVSDSQSLVLADYDVSAVQLAPGALLTMTLYWRASQRVVGNYIAVIHLLDVSYRVVTNTSAVHAVGQWSPGERVTETHLFALPRDLVPGEYHLAVGRYDTSTRASLAAPFVLTRSIYVTP